ncbi:hypothetical protein BYT27DRAFT_7190259 [Phlegmacium glaucopus]|nr:hypothetical protein BYT27DRAFT_7190259 [Phlegmacium glaucopus]
MEWHDTDPSDDEQNHHEATARKRSSRACDQCRKTKSKCERQTISGDSKRCKSCTFAGTACTFLGPSYKRGPPKGYIHAIEQRWHQVESLLGAILQCPDPRVQSIVYDLRQDDLAREILGRVDTGPYGPSGRRSQPPDATKEDFFASILRSNEAAHIDSSRARRQSRVSREIVSSNQDHGLSVVPTKEWQENLSKRLAFGSNPDTRPPDNITVPVMQKRRLNGTNDNQPKWDSLYTIEPTPEDDVKSTFEGMGQLSLDENQEVRFHGDASGLHLLGRNQRTDDRNEGGVWRLPMARVWPPSKFGIPTYPLSQNAVDLPPQDTQDRLLDLYFTNIHPIFPVIHKTQFLTEYNARKNNDGRDLRDSPSSSASPRPEPTQEVTPLLLLSIFSIAARLTGDDLPNPSDNKMWEAGYEYLECAQHILTKIFQCSRPSTVQALLLLGYREFGIGSMELGWIYIGCAIRMAFDLGLNCNSSKWKMHGHDLFSAEETQIRRQIWWACCQTDSYGSVYMGRPTMIKYEDYETPLPNVHPIEERSPWQPTSTANDINYPPVASRVMGAFCASSRLVVIVGAIVTQIYPVRPTPGPSRKTMLADLESRLDHWYITLPEELRYEASNKRQTPPPQILFLHLRYWSAVLLLHRAFIPNRHDETLQRSLFGTKSFDLAHSAACHVGALVTAYRETFTMKRTSPFLTSHLLSASVMHIMTMTIRPENFEASTGLDQCMTALKEMAIVWPSASRAWDLLNGVKLRTHVNPLAPFPPHHRYPDRHKRPAEDAFEERAAYSRREPAVNNASGVQEINTRLMAHMLGLEVPGNDPSTYYLLHSPPPFIAGGSSQPSSQQPSSQQLLYPSSAGFTSDMQTINPVVMSGDGTGAGSSWAQNIAAPGSYGINNYMYDFEGYGV